MLNALFPVFAVHSKSSKDVFFLKQNVNIFSYAIPRKESTKELFFFPFVSLSASLFAWSLFLPNDNRIM